MQIREDAFIPHISAYNFRHTASTRMAECNMNQKQHQRIMGHEQFETTMNVYTHANKDIDDLKIPLGAEYGELAL